jgi:phage terminase large subunit-like protein
VHPPIRTGRHLPAVGSAALVAAFAAGCSGSSGATTSQPTQSAVPTPTCPTVAPTPSATTAALAKALQNVPFDLPMPDNISIVGATTTNDGVRVVRFTTPTSLRTAVLFIVQRYPKSGYVIGRGDAEATEADAPFVHGQVRGLTRVVGVQGCQTLWLVATVATTNNGVTSPILVPHPTSSVTSALPFG